MRARLKSWALVLSLALAIESACYAASAHHGFVFFGEIPIPGAVVRATQAGHEFLTVTDSDGAFSFAGLDDGSWTFQVEMSGFVPSRQDLRVTPDTAPTVFQLKMVSAGDTNAEPAPSPGALPQYDLRHDTTDVFLINGSSNDGTSRAFGNNRRRTASPYYTTNLNLTTNSSALDARSFSLTGTKAPEPAYNRSEASITLEGPLPLFFQPGAPRFTLIYSRMQNQDVTLQAARVPTLAERVGNFSGTTLSVIDPVSGSSFLENSLPRERITPQADALLRFYPAPNVIAGSGYNFQAPISAATHRDYLQLQTGGLVHGHQLSGNFGFQSTRTDNPSIFGFVDKLNASSVNGSFSWSRSLKERYSTTISYSFSKTAAQTTPHFAYRENVSGLAGVTGNSQDPQNWGPPNINFSGGIAALYETQYGLDRTQTQVLSQSSDWTRSRHALSHGFQFTRQRFDLLSERDARGTFTFTGTASGNDFADFLLGLPAASSISFGNPQRYFRQSVLSAFLMDDWKIAPSLTLNAGIRWDYEAPIEERNGRLVNLDITPDYGAVLPVVADQPIGLLTGRLYPHSLIRPDRTGFQPRVGLAWRPRADSSWVIRAGYGIYRDTAVYRTIAGEMSRQFPLSTTLSVQNSALTPLTLANGFIASPVNAPVTFAVDPNFRISYAQNWQLSLQHDLPAALQLTATYLGIKGTRLPQRTLPQTFPAGGSPVCSCPAGYVYLSSNGNSNQHAATIQVRRRQTARITSSVEYTWAKAIDDAGLGGALIAQDWMNPRAERAFSNFDRRHRLTLQAGYTPGLLPGIGSSLGNGWMGALLREWTIMGEWRMSGGSPLTPVLIAPVQGTGVTGTLRPDRTVAPMYGDVAGKSFLNAEAFSLPAPGQWGNAGRNSIRGPEQSFLDASIGRRFTLDRGIAVDLRVDVTNVLNHVTFADWNTTMNSSQFGLPLRANGMRTIRPSLQVSF